VLPGEADGSFGLDVAKLANLPQTVINRAQTILKTLEIKDKQKDSALFAEKNAEIGIYQDTTVLEQELANLKQVLREKDEIIKEIYDIRVDDLSPRKAFDVIWALKSKQKSL